MEINAVVIGQEGVGKSAFVVRVLTKKFISEYSRDLEGIYRKEN